MKYANIKKEWHWVYGTSTFQWLLRVVNAKNELSEVADGFILAIMKYRNKFLCQDEVDETVSESLLRLTKSQFQFKGRCKVSTYAYVVLKNTAINVAVQNQRRRVNEAMIRMDEEPIDICMEDKITLVQELNSGINRLNPGLKQALIFDLNGLDYESASKVQGVPIGTHRSRLNRAREQITKYMKGDWDYGVAQQVVQEALSQLETSEGAP